MPSSRVSTGRTNRVSSSGEGIRPSTASMVLSSSRLRESAGCTPGRVAAVTKAVAALVTPPRPSTGSLGGRPLGRSASEPSFGTTAFSRPVMSKKLPLRTLLLDPESNNMPRSRTRSEFKKKLRGVNVPHWSYDLDGDGEVSHDDYKISKALDALGTGQLSPVQRTRGRKTLASQFFRNHQRDAHLYGSQWTARPGSAAAEENAERLATNPSFNYSLCKLNMKEKRLINHGSYDMTVCMSDAVPEAPPGAGNARDAPPPTNFYPDTHGGSRQTLFEKRSIATRAMAQSHLDIAETKRPQFSTKRISLITNWAFENG
ncbi:hypothetical protein SO694_0044802 [Aureococcus anophagefferens]|uniref:EF-hand domain-containing protein n=1 Tax=Aureococcus anophagefferens TaxID=44056 RepID=A0ABR1G934_AURAN|nr:hypothetical protein JL720_8394 [Aureococcus anophagefferens]